MQGTQHAKSAVRAGAAAISAAFAVQRGVSIHALRDMCGVDGVELMRPDARIDAQVLAQLWRNLESKFPGQLLPLEMCLAAPLTLAGDIPHGAQFADNLGESVELFRQNSTLLGDRLEIEVAGLGEQDAVHITITHPLDAFAYGTLTELRLGFAWRLLSEFASAPIELRRVEFEHCPNGAQEDYERHFWREVRFEQPTSALVVSPNVLEVPMSQASAA